ALDASPIALSFLVARAGRSVWAVRGDALALGLRDGVFDLVVSADMIEHVADGETYLREMRRVLKPAGRCVLITNNDRGLFKVKGLRRLYYQPTKRLDLRRKLDAIKATERARRYDERAHINLFSVARLAALARLAGFSVAHWHTFPFLRHPLRDHILSARLLRFLFGPYLHDYLLMVLEKPRAVAAH
ncbi:MAG: class I SAM-dependent methyltransferase, partial [Candidatus Binatia bacterium]